MIIEILKHNKLDFALQHIQVLSGHPVVNTPLITSVHVPFKQYFIISNNDFYSGHYLPSPISHNWHVGPK